MTFGEIFTIVTNTGARITRISVPVANTPLTVGIIPRSRLTLVARPTVGLRTTFTLAAEYIAEIIQRTDAMAVAS